MKKFFRFTLNLMFVLLGILSAGLGLKGFLLPNHFIDGGVTGISMLAAALTGVRLPILIMVINAPFILTGFFRAQLCAQKRTGHQRAGAEPGPDQLPCRHA
jgi:uncharacterized membrane-anchored protein YitT (DUF2179 family)